jgi:hypothetical protein
MTHQQVLDKLAAKHLVKSIDDDLATLVFKAMCYEKNDTNNQLLYILPRLLDRWNCILNDDDTVSDIYKQKTALALSILLHKYGFRDKDLISKSMEAIDELNNNVVLGDDFFRKTEEIKKLLTSTPITLKRKPAFVESITFYREKDVISIHLENRFYAAYIHEISGVNESPIIEFYDGVFDRIPTLEELKNLPAKGMLYTDGVKRISLHSVYGMKHQPDLANQIHLISACVENPPSNDHLEKPTGLYTVSDLFSIQKAIKEMFNAG